MSPSETSSGSTRVSLPSRSTTAKSGRSSVSEEMDLRERSTAICSNSSPIWKKIMTAAASPQSFIAMAQTVASAIKKFSSKT